MEDYQCLNCKKVFINQFKLIAHERQKCMNKSCDNCNSTFHRTRDFVRHLKQRKNISCDHCPRIFCSNDHFQQHLRTISTKNNVPDLDQHIYAATGYENYKGYQDLVKEKSNDINDYDKVSVYELINRRIDSKFTYRNLENLILDIYCKQKNVFKVNLSFGYIIFNIKTDEFKYYYNSSNNLLFERAQTISNRNDVTKFMRKIINLDLATNYYMKKHLCLGLSNIQISIFPIPGTLIG